MHKSCNAKIKAVGDDTLLEGQFRAIVSVFGNKDSYGDVILKGAFADTLAEWQESGDPIPVIYSHQMNDPDMNIGYVVDAKETDVGLEILAQLDVGEAASSKAKSTYQLMKGGRLKSFSFAYDVLDGGAVEKDGDSYFELRKLKLYEVGPTLVGANSETELLAVKAAAERVQAMADGVLDLKVGRVLSAKHENTLRDALEALDASAAQIKSVLAAVAAEDDDSKASSTRTSKASDTDSIKHEHDGEPVAKCEESRRKSTAVELWEFDLSLTDLEGVTL